MRKSIYPKLAWEGIRKNKKLCLPYLLTCICMIMMTYIVNFLIHSEIVHNMSGGTTVVIMMEFGSWVLIIFSLIFLFYTSSFVNRRRKKELGLYNVLGMGKREIAKILIWENLINTLISLSAGLLLGVIFSKLAELGILNMVHCQIDYTLSISPSAVGFTCGLYIIIFLLIMLNTLRQIHFSDPLSLMRSENYGEKPPKANVFLGLSGILLLIAAYCLAVSIQSPIEAMAWFFVAVIMVIVATYLIFISGSVMICRMLQKNKRYYYRPNHFVSVSSMCYRMKRNGAGLASICILSTMVLVIVSTTTCLYFGIENSLNRTYPRDILYECHFTQEDTADGVSDVLPIFSEDTLAVIRENLRMTAEKHNLPIQNPIDLRSIRITCFRDNDTVICDKRIGSGGYRWIGLTIVPLSDYNLTMNVSETLSDHEVLLFDPDRSLYPNQEEPHSVLIGDTHLSVKRYLETMETGDITYAGAVQNNLYIVVSDFDAIVNDIIRITEESPTFRWRFAFDTAGSDEDQIAFGMSAYKNISFALSDGIINYNSITVKAEARIDFYRIYGGIFFLGILLSMIFLFAAVLIIYYKQISEGYEDQSRFEIMQKVGMTKTDIKKSINSQLLTVFFLPLLIAAMHLAFAFPMIRKMLLLFNLTNIWLFAVTTGLSFLAFVLFYTLIYRITSNAYYHIVSEGKK